jgi:pyruvate formate lyase activating enzyme
VKVSCDVVSDTPCDKDLRGSIKVNLPKNELKEAMLYNTMLTGNVKCNLCARHCAVSLGKRGYCGVRENRGGILYSLVYGRACAWAVDPIEKKPFYHFFPGSTSFSFSTVGCNFRCPWCQNWEISQPNQIFGEDLSPEKIVRMTKNSEAQGIAYTYTEPTIFMEYAKDTAELARKEGLYNVFVSNGYMTDEAATEATKFLDAIRIDLKAFNPETYKKHLAADIEVVKKNIAEFNKRMHVEVINLIIPTVNDSDDEIRAMAEWMKEVDPTIPIHFTAYYPSNKFTVAPTPPETLQRARKIAQDVGLHYVYTGNVPGDPGENTYCPNCDVLLIKRFGFTVIENRVADGKCPGCGHKIKMVTKLPWMSSGRP